MKKATSKKESLLHEIAMEAFEKSTNVIGEITLPEEACFTGTRLKINEDGSATLISSDDIIILSEAQVTMVGQARDAILEAFNNGKNA